MQTIENLKHNKTQQVVVPRPREMYRQYGLTRQLNASKYSGDETLDPNLDKIGAAKAAAAAEADLLKKEEESKEE